MVGTRVLRARHLSFVFGPTRQKYDQQYRGGDHKVARPAGSHRIVSSRTLDAEILTHSRRWHASVNWPSQLSTLAPAISAEASTESWLVPQLNAQK